MNEEEDRRWLDGLAGRGAVAAASQEAVASPEGASALAARREGAALREAVQALRADGQQGNGLPNDGAGSDAVPAIDARREAQLLARARREGLLPPVRSRWPALAAAAAVGVLAVGIAWLQRPASPPAEVVRGQPDAVQRVSVADPAAAQTQLLAALRAAGIDARGYAVLDRRGVDADLPQPPPADVARILRQWHLAAPDDGVLRVEFVAESGP